MLRFSEDETLLDQLEAVADTLRASLRGALEDARVPLAPMEARALAFLQAHPGCSQADFVQAAGRDKGQVARLVKLLAERGLLVTLPDQHDRRVGRLWLTENGQELVREVRAQRLRCGRQLLAGLDARERARLGTLLAKALPAPPSGPPPAAANEFTAES